MKEFNTTAVCIPSKHYMVDISERVKEIKKLVDAGKYFTMNRARQYGKTTTLHALCSILNKRYLVISTSFQRLGTGEFCDEHAFSDAFVLLICEAIQRLQEIPLGLRELLEKMQDNATSYNYRLLRLFTDLKALIRISDKPIVLMIDEVDSAANNQVFLDFLSQLREGYISRETDNTPAFHSVILAGVTDIRYIKNKIREEDLHKVNSPWNIAADFNIDMSLSEPGIKGMLEDYETDHHTGMDAAEMAKQIRAYTNGYPFLVSRICQLLDTVVSKQFASLSETWTRRGLDEAIKLLLAEDNTLFQSLIGKLENLPELKDTLRSILMDGIRIPYNGMQSSIAQMKMYGFIRNENNAVRISNRIFETMLYNYFLTEGEMKSSAFYKEGQLGANRFVKDGKLDMRLIMERFIATYEQVCGPLVDRFKEKDGREQFLLFLKPIINGTGNYYIEAQTRDQTRTDVIVDYLGQQYIIELKIWRGERYNEEGEQQIREYLDYWNLDTGYMLSFNFNKKKETGVKRVEVGDKVLYEGTV